MKRVFTYSIDRQVSIKNFLKEHHYSRDIMVFLRKDESRVLLNGKPSKLNVIADNNDKLEIIFEEAIQDSIVETEMPLDIVYENEDIVIINKQASLPVHPSKGNYDHTLANAFAFHYHSQIPFRCINRLDKDTTGLTIIAKNMYAASLYTGEMLKREIKRTYLAIVEGITDEKGIVEAPIARIGETIMRTVDYENGEYALTEYRKIKDLNGKNLSLIELHLHTGRTHQIRVHMKHLHHPIIGDSLYNPDYTYIARQALHAWKLEFRDPFTHEHVTVTADLPEDMKRVLED